MNTQTMSLRRGSAVNAATLARHINDSGLMASLPLAAQAVLTSLLFDVHMNDWAENRPIAKTRREDLADKIGIGLKTIQRALQDLEAAGLVVRKFNDLHHAIGVDFSPAVAKFHQIAQRSAEERQRRRQRYQEGKEARDAARDEAAAARAQKNLRWKDASSQMDTCGQLNTNPLPESESSGCTRTGKGDVAGRETVHRPQAPCPDDDRDIEAQAAETVPELETWRSVLYRIHPGFRDIARDNTVGGDPMAATLDELWDAADILRERVGFRWKDLEMARRRHGRVRTLIFFVSMTAPAAVALREIRNVQGYIVAGLAKPPAEFCPVKSMWGIYKSMREAGFTKQRASGGAGDLDAAWQRLRAERQGRGERR